LPQKQTLIVMAFEVQSRIQPSMINTTTTMMIMVITGNTNKSAAYTVQ